MTIFVTTSSFRSLNDDKKVVKVIFTNQLNVDDLAKIRLDLLEKGIVLNFKTLDFNRKGKLIGIDFSVDCKDGFSGHSATNRLAAYKEYGLYRNYDEEANVPFAVGEVKDIEKP